MPLRLRWFVAVLILLVAWPTTVSASLRDQAPASPASLLTTYPTITDPNADQELSAGSTAQVTGTDGIGLAVRIEPSIGANMLAVLTDGAIVEVLAAPETAEGERWYLIRHGFPSTTGWVRGQFLAPYGSSANGPNQAPIFQAPRATPTTMPSTPGQGRIRLGQDTFAILLDPCRAVEFQLVARGVSPIQMRNNVGLQMLSHRVWPMMLPVLATITVASKTGGR